MKAMQIAGIVQAIQAGEHERKLAKELAAKEKASAQQAATAQRQADAAARQEVNQQQAAAQAQIAQQIAQISHCQNIELVRSICERVTGILTSQEVIQYVAVQQKPLVNIAPDAMIATNRRLIFYRPKLLGRYEFADYMWYDLANAHIQQNLLGAVFTARHASGQVLSMDYLPKESAQAIYRLSQEREEQAKLARHQVQLDTMRAGATQVNVGNMPQAAPAAMPGPTPANAQADIMQRMQTLKMMFDQGMITQQDFETRKQQILASI